MKQYDLDYIVENWDNLPVTYKVELIARVTVAKYRAYIRLGTAVIIGGLSVYLVNVAGHLAVGFVVTILMMMVFCFAISIVDNSHTW